MMIVNIFNDHETLSTVVHVKEAVWDKIENELRDVRNKLLDYLITRTIRINTTRNIDLD